MDHHGCARSVETFLTGCQRLREQLAASLQACGMEGVQRERIDSVVKWSAANLHADLGREMDDIGSEQRFAAALVERVRRALAADDAAMDATPGNRGGYGLSPAAAGRGCTSAAAWH